MRKLLLALAFSLLSTASFAQTCPTRGTSDSSNSCASTAFVHNVAATITSGINQLTGDVTAGPGSGSQAATLVTAQPGAHTWAAIQTFTLAPVFTDPAGTQAAIGINPQAIVNCTLAFSRPSNALSVALKTASGANPSATLPCLFAFQDGSGGFSAVSVTAATSFTTATSGSTFGASNSQAFSLYVTAWNNAGTVVLGVSRQSTAVAIFPINEFIAQSSTACSACGTATSANVYYTTAAQSSKFLRIFARLTWNSGLTTAGTFDANPSTIELNGPGFRKPGDIFNSSFTQSATSATAGVDYTPSNTLPTTGNSALAVAAPSWTPTSAANHVRISANVFGGGSSANTSLTGFLVAGSTVLAAAGQMSSNNSVAIVTVPIIYEGLNPSGATVYGAYLNGNTGTITTNALNGGSSAIYGGLPNSALQIVEVQG